MESFVRMVTNGRFWRERSGCPFLPRRPAFQNPEFYKAQAMRLPTFNKPRVIACGEDLADHIALPRGCLVEIIELLKSHGIKPIVRDERRSEERRGGKE